MGTFLSVHTEGVFPSSNTHTTTQRKDAGKAACTNRQGGAEGTDERVLSLHTDACEMVEVTSVEEGHDVESYVAVETMSALVRLAKEICESCDIGQLTAECLLCGLPGARWLHGES